MEKHECGDVGEDEGRCRGESDLDFDVDVVKQWSLRSQ